MQEQGLTLLAALMLSCGETPARPPSAASIPNRPASFQAPAAAVSGAATAGDGGHVPRVRPESDYVSTRPPVVQEWIHRATRKCRIARTGGAPEACIGAFPSGAIHQPEDTKECVRRCLTDWKLDLSPTDAEVETCVGNARASNFSQPARCHPEIDAARLRANCDAECERRIREEVGRSIMPVRPGGRIRTN